MPEIFLLRQSGTTPQLRIMIEITLAVLAIVTAFTGYRLATAAKELVQALPDAFDSAPAPQWDRIEEIAAKLDRIEGQVAEEVHRSGQEILEAAIRAEGERLRVEQTLTRAFKRISKGEDGQSAIHAEAVAAGIVHEDFGDEQGVLPMRESMGTRGEGGIRSAAAHKFGA